MSHYAWLKRSDRRFWILHGNWPIWNWENGQFQLDPVTLRSLNVLRTINMLRYVIVSRDHVLRGTSTHKACFLNNTRNMLNNVQPFASCALVIWLNSWTFSLGLNHSFVLDQDPAVSADRAPSAPGPNSKYCGGKENRPHWSGHEHDVAAVTPIRIVCVT